MSQYSRLPSALLTRTNRFAISVSQRSQQRPRVRKSGLPALVIRVIFALGVAGAQLGLERRQRAMKSRVRMLSSLRNGRMEQIPTIQRIIRFSAHLTGGCLLSSLGFCCDAALQRIGLETSLSSYGILVGHPGLFPFIFFAMP
jgi:hypothetical protein